MILGVVARLVQALARRSVPMLERSVGLGGDEYVGSLHSCVGWSPGHGRHWELGLLGVERLQRVGQLARRQVVYPSQTVSVAGRQVSVIVAESGAKDGRIGVPERRAMHDFAHDTGRLINLLAIADSRGGWHSLSVEN